MSEDKNCRAVKPSQVYCEICNVYVSSASLLATHIKGKKHQQLQKLQDAHNRAARLSVYVSGFKCSETNEHEMSSFFSSFGKVNKIYFDKNKGAFAIIEFEEEKSALDVLQKEDPFIFNGKPLKIKKRTFSKQKSQESSKSPEQNLKRKKRCSSETNAGSFFPKEIINKLNPLDSVSQQIDLLMSELRLTDEDIQLRLLVCKILEEVFKEFSPTVEVVSYGSSVSGLGYKGSDLDITILIDKHAMEVELDSEDTDPRPGMRNGGSKVYMFIVKVLRSIVPGCSHVMPIYNAKCPVIKFTHDSSGLSCDLTINNRLGIQNTKLIQCYMSLDPRVPQLVYFVRPWAKALGLLGDSSHLTSYAWTLMVIYFLQTTNPPVIPSLQNISKWPINSCGKDNEKKKLEECIIDGWDCSFFEDVTSLSPSLNPKPIGKIIEEFFDFYGSKFDYGNCAVSIRKGKTCTILSLEEELQEIELKMNHEELSDSISMSESSIVSDTLLEIESRKETDHKSEQANSKEMATVWKTTPLCVQDPFELTHNVTQNVGIFSLRNFIQCMKDGYQICSTFPSDGHLADSSGIAAFFRSPSKISTKRKKRDCYSFLIYLCRKSEADEVGPLKIPAVAMTCLKYSSSEELFDAFRQYLEHELQMKCDLESACRNQTPKGGLSVICTALTNTWTYCRRERRKCIKGKNKLLPESDLEKSHNTSLYGSLSEDSETKTRPMDQSSSATEKELIKKETPPIHYQLDENKAELVFRLSISENVDATDKKGVECITVKLEHIDGSGLQSFENFYAFFKKQVQTLFL